MRWALYWSAQSVPTSGIRLIGRLFFKLVISDHFPYGDDHFSFTTLCKANKINEFMWAICGMWVIT